MNKYSITNNSNSLTFQVIGASLPETYPVEWGKSARWIPLTEADAFELSQEDNRREVDLGNGETRTEIHVPDDFTIEITDVTLEHEAAIKTRKNQVKKQMASDAIVYINGIIEDWTINEKITLLGRQDIPVILNFLNYGSINQSRDLCASLVTDSLITEEIKSNILNFLDLKIAEFNAMVF